MYVKEPKKLSLNEIKPTGPNKTQKHPDESIENSHNRTK